VGSGCGATVGTDSTAAAAAAFSGAFCRFFRLERLLHLLLFLRHLALDLFLDLLRIDRRRRRSQGRRAPP
jgi:hypothetical protein